MPIPKKIKSRDMAGQDVIIARRFRTGACAVEIPAGTVLRVKDASRGFMLESPEPCPACGVSVRLDSVIRDQAFMAGDPDAPPLDSVAFWNSRAEQNDHAWCQCSNCGFMVENYVAVKQGISSDDYIGVEWPYCPKCGKRMAIRNAAGKVVL